MKLLLKILTVLLVTGSCTGEKHQNLKKQPTRVKTEVVSVGGYGNNQNYVGVVEETDATAVSFTSMGVITRMHVREGQFVNKGQLIAEMDNTTMSNTLEITRVSTSQAQDLVAQAQTTYDHAKDAYERMKAMYEEGTLPEIKWIEAETRLKQAETALKTAQSGVLSAKASEKIAQKGVEDSRLFAPVSGVIGRLMLGAGETALPSQAVANILNIDLVKVKVSVPELELKEIEPGMLSLVSVAAADKSLLGGKIEKGVEADMLTHTYDVKVWVNNRDHALLPGMVANVVFGKETRVDAVMVPVRSVQKDQNGRFFVWTVTEDSVARRTYVSTGTTHGNRITILGGVDSGQRLVVEGYQKLCEGTKVVF